MGADFCLEMIERGTSSESSFISDTFALSLMLSESGRNSEEAVFEDRESCGRWPLVGRGKSIETARGKVGDIGCGGLFAGKLTGLIGM